MELHHADIAYRRRSIRALSAATLLLAIGLAALHGWLGDVIASLPRMDAVTQRTWLRWLFTGLFVGLAVPFALTARSFHRFARDAQRERRLPPERWRTWRDVRVLRGPAAARWTRRAHRVATVCAIVAGLLGCAAVASWWRYG